MSESRQVNATIYAKAHTTATLEDKETIEGFKNRWVDIYLQGACGNESYKNKQDLGGSSVIVLDDEPELALVDKGFLLALIDTAKRTTDLEAVYNDETNEDYLWSNLDQYIKEI